MVLHKLVQHLHVKTVEPLSGLVTSTKEKIDPLRRDYQADPNLPAGVKGVMQALNKMEI